MAFMYKYTKTMKEAVLLSFSDVSFDSYLRSKVSPSVSRHSQTTVEQTPERVDEGTSKEYVCVCRGEGAMIVLNLQLTCVAQHPRGCGTGYKVLWLMSCSSIFLRAASPSEHSQALDSR